MEELLSVYLSKQAFIWDRYSCSVWDLEVSQDEVQEILDEKKRVDKEKSDALALLSDKKWKSVSRYFRREKSESFDSQENDSHSDYEISELKNTMAWLTKALMGMKYYKQ